MLHPTPPPVSGGRPRWIRTPTGLAQAAVGLRAGGVLAVDSESDSLHHFPEKVCLVQLATPQGDVYLLDPLVVRDLEPLGALLADRAVVKVLHGAAYDVACLKRDFAVAFASIFDTMLAAQFLGMPEVGLAALLRRLLGVATGESRQKDDWATRPLSAEQEQYAAEDVRHLIALREHLLLALKACGRDGWVAEECRALEALPPSERVFRADDCFTIKGARSLDRRGLAVLRELFIAREASAHASGRPPFKVVGNDTLLRLAVRRPMTQDEAARIPGCTPTVMHRHGQGMLEAVRRGMAVPEAGLPILRRPKPRRLPPAEARRVETLLAWRAEAAVRWGLDPGLLFPRRLIERVAEAAPTNLHALEALDGMRHWRVAAFGEEILGLLNGSGALPAQPVARQARLPHSR